MNEKVKILILLGVTADKIQAAVTNYEGYDEKELKIVRVNSLEEAVQMAKELARRGYGLLSPACASFDMYPNFEVRGQHFSVLLMLCNCAFMLLSSLRKQVQIDNQYKLEKER